MEFIPDPTWIIIYLIVCALGAYVYTAIVEHRERIKRKEDDH